MDDEQRELGAYLRRVGDRWPLEAAYHRRRSHDEEHLVVLVSQAFDGMPWLERTTTARNLWDSGVMRGGVDVHCYTPAEAERKRGTVRPLAAAIEKGREVPLR
jgi:hypothetical protein